MLSSMLKGGRRFSTLYKQNNNDSLQQWTVVVVGNAITSTWGLKGGKLQETTEVVLEGKNLGRSNATTPESQALVQGQQLFDAKLKEGYVEDLELASSTKNTLEAIEPMLAHPIEKKEKYAVFPALAQPKSDGVRALVILKKGKARMFSRTQKEIFTMPHIVAEIETLFDKDIICDGELYVHTLKKDFNKITSIIKRDDVHPEHTKIQYHIYDVVGLEDYQVRTAVLSRLSKAKYCKQVETIIVKSREELEQYQVDCVDNGYEGAMYRSVQGGYDHKRSTRLLKVKSFQDAEFEILDLEEGKGKLLGHVGAFICRLPNGGVVRASPLGSHDLLKEYWDRRKTLVGQRATIKFQGYTPDGSLRFPKIKTVRDYE